MENTNNMIYWVWLSLIFSAGSDKPNQILSVVDSPEAFYNMSRDEMLELEFLTERDIKLIKTVSLDRAQLVIDDCERQSISIVTMENPLFPNRLRVIYGPPIVLYVLGDISGIDDEVLITIVGTRKASDYTAYATEYMAYHLSKAGAIIVSGCAVGIDTCAHKGAIKAGARTISILGCGLDIDYPHENRQLKTDILKNGALISELPPGTPVVGRMFPVRNRLMAGIALGVFVTHAPERSGSLITAEHAIEQGKDLFCLPPHNIFDTQYHGVIKYIRDGATPVFNPKDILIEYYGTHSHKLKVDKIIGNYINQRKKSSETADVKPKLTKKINSEPSPDEITATNIDDVRAKHTAIIADLSSEQVLVYNALTLSPRFIDEISADVNISVGSVLSILTELEIYGVIGSFSGRRYALMK